MDQTESRKKFIINALYFVILFTIVVLILKYAFYPLLPIFLSILIAVLLQRPTNFLSKKTKLPRALVATVLVLILLGLIGYGIYALGVQIVNEVQGFFFYIKEYVSDYNWIESQVYSVVNSLPKFVYDNVIDDVDGAMSQLKVAMANDAEVATANTGVSSFDWSAITGSLTSGIGAGVSGVIATAKQIPSILVAIITGIILSVFMTIEYSDIIKIIESVIGPKKSEQFEKIRNTIKSSVGKLLKAYAVICAITFSELAIGLTVLKVIGVYKGGYVLVIALITALLDILPVLGIGTVMWPWMAYALITGRTGLLIGLFVVYLIITVVRHIIEPKLVSDTLELPAALTLSVMYIGLKYFGIIGMFAFVIILYCIVALDREGVINVTTKTN